MAHDVFVSYPHADKAVADAVVNTLEGRRVRCWVAPRDVPLGADWAGSIVDAIEGSRLVVLVFSNTTNQSEHILREVRAASDADVAIVPFRTADVEPDSSLRYYLGGTHWLDALTEPIEQHLEVLASTVARMVGVADDAAQPAPSSMPAEPSIASPVAPLARERRGRTAGFPRWGVVALALAAVVFVGVGIGLLQSDGGDPSAEVGTDEPDGGDEVAEPNAVTDETGGGTPLDELADVPPETALSDGVASEPEEPADDSPMSTGELSRSDGSEFGGFETPIGVAVDALGRVLVADELSGAIRVFDPDDGYLFSFPATTPHGLAVGPGGEIYSLSFAENIVETYDESGNLMMSWGGSGSADGEFDRPVHVAADQSGYVYVTEGMGDNRRVQKFDADGIHLQTWTTWGEEQDFGTLKGIATGMTGSEAVVYVGDEQGKVHRFDQDGNHQLSWDGVSPTGITVDAAGDIYVIDEFRGLLTRHDSDGTVLETWSSDDFMLPFDVAVDQSGRIWVTDQAADLVFRFGEP